MINYIEKDYTAYTCISWFKPSLLPNLIKFQNMGKGQGSFAFPSWHAGTVFEFELHGFASLLIWEILRHCLMKETENLMNFCWNRNYAKRVSCWMD